MTSECDIEMDEQSTADVTVSPINNDGTAIDLTSASEITWVASFNGVQQVKKDLAQMTVMLSAQTSTYPTTEAAAAQKNVICNKVEAFGLDGYRRPISDFAVGDTVVLTNINNQREFCVIDSINSKTLTMVDNLTYTYPITTSTVKKIITSFEFQLLAGDTILPATKSYGTKIIWEHMAQAVFPAGLSPGNIYQEDTTLILIRGRMFVEPILDIT
jgi:hypothetical protein